MLRGGASGFLHLPVSSVLQRPPFRKRPPTASAAYKLLDLIISKYDHKYDIQSKQQMLISQSKVLFLLTRSPVPPSLFLDGRGLAHSASVTSEAMLQQEAFEELQRCRGSGKSGCHGIRLHMYVHVRMCVLYVYIYIYIIFIYINNIYI